MNEAKQVPWTGEPNQRAINYLNEEGKVIVCPTKVGYIIAVSDKKGLERKFSAKNRKRNKPGVVLCSSLRKPPPFTKLAGTMTCYSARFCLGKNQEKPISQTMAQRN